MKSAVREYGMIVVVIATAMVGYLFYNYNKEAVIDYALDNIGERLVALVGDPSSQETLRDKFAALKSRILDEEVESAAVQQMAANVLNLSAAGSPITLDEAEMILSDVTDASAPAASSQAGRGKQSGIVKPEAPAPPKKVKVELDKLGDHLASVIKAEEDFRKMAKASGTAEPLPPFVVITTEDGLRFQVDSMMVEVFADNRMPESIREMQKQKFIVWKKHLAEDRKMTHEKAQAELEHVREHLEKAKEIQSLAISRTGDNVEVSVSLAPEVIEKIRVLKELESKGVWIPAVPDSIQRMVINRVVVEQPVAPVEKSG